jgi:hypothetical protein
MLVHPELVCMCVHTVVESNGRKEFEGYMLKLPTYMNPGT